MTYLARYATRICHLTLAKHYGVIFNINNNKVSLHNKEQYSDIAHLYAKDIGMSYIYFYTIFNSSFRI